MVKDNNLMIDNNLGQKLVELKKSKKHQNLAKYQNLAKSRKLNYHPKLSKFKKVILNKFKILINLIVVTNASAIKYLTTKKRIAFT